MRTFDLIFNGIDQIRMVITHKFFLILGDGGNAIDISVRKSSGFNEVKGVLAGFGFRLAEDSRGQEFIFNSSVAQTVKIFVGDDEAIYNRLSGTVTINGGSLTGINSTVKTVNDGAAPGSYYANNTVLAANSPVAVFLPAANVNGAVIYDARFYSASGGFTLPALIAKNGAPASNIDGNVLLMADAVANTTTRELCASLKNTIQIPAGLGLYFFSQVLETNGHRSVAYTLK